MHKIDKKKAAKVVASPSSSSNSQASTADPRRGGSSGSTSTSSSTTLRGCELSIRIEDTDAFALDDVMDEMFGKDDEENTLHATPDGDIDGDQLTVDTASALNTPVDGEALMDHRIKLEDIAMA